MYGRSWSVSPPSPDSGDAIGRSVATDGCRRAWRVDRGLGLPNVQAAPAEAEKDRGVVRIAGMCLLEERQGALGHALQQKKVSAVLQYTRLVGRDTLRARE